MGLDPIGEPRTALGPMLEPRLQGLLQVAAVVEPAELLPAIVIGLAGQGVECVAEKMHGTPLPHRLGEQFHARPPQPGDVSGWDGDIRDGNLVAA